jgi:hypothetical protein
MTAHKYTIVCEFRGGTYVTQVLGNDVIDAVKSWGGYLVRERPIPRVSPYLAKAVAVSIDQTPPVELDGLSYVWCVTALCGGDLMLANIVETANSANDS